MFLNIGAYGGVRCYSCHLEGRGAKRLSHFVKIVTCCERGQTCVNSGKR